MARNQTRFKRGSNLHGKDKSQHGESKIKLNGDAENMASNSTDVEDEPEVLAVPSSSCDPQGRGSKGEQTDNDDEEEVEEETEKMENLKRKKSDDKKEEAEKGKKGKNTKKRSKDEKNEVNSLNRFPMNRICRIIRTENSDFRISQEAIFLINKASEKFLELFCKEAYACAFLEWKNYVGYNHLSSIISKRKRFDFVADYVPEKVNAEDALGQLPSADV